MKRLFSRPAAALVVMLAISCGDGGPAPEPVVETVDVGFETDAYLETRFDQRGPRPMAGISGMLPSDFPENVPLLTPASLIDFGDSPGGGRFVVLQSPTPAAATIAGQLDRLRSAGWQTSRAGNAWLARRGAVALRLSIDSAASMSDLRIEYGAFSDRPGG